MEKISGLRRMARRHVLVPLGGMAQSAAAFRVAAVGGGAVAAAPQPAMVEFGRTTNFIVSYDDALGADGPTISQAIIDTCEADYQTLQGYFGGITPARLPFNVQATTDN